MREWSVSSHDNCIWISGANLSNRNDILNKVRELDPYALSFRNSYYDVHAIHTKTRSYYCISNAIYSRNDEDLVKWAKSQTGKHDDYYNDEEFLEELDKFNRIPGIADKLLTVLAYIAGFVPVVSFAWSFRYIIPIFIPGVLGGIIFGIGISDLLRCLLKEIVERCKIKYAYIFTRTGVILDVWHFNPIMSERHVKKLLNEMLSNRGEIKILKNDKRLRISINEPHPSIDTTTDEALRILDSSDDEAFHIVKMDADTSIENNSTRIVEPSESETVEPASLERLMNLYKDISNLESEVLADNKISRQVKDKIDVLTDDGAIQANVDSSRTIEELEDIKSRLTRLKNDNNGIHESLKDIDEIARMKKLQS